MSQTEVEYPEVKFLWLNHRNPTVELLLQTCMAWVNVE